MQTRAILEQKESLEEAVLLIGSEQIQYIIKTTKYQLFSGINHLTFLLIMLS